jgi:hypothetical protein
MGMNKKTHGDVPWDKEDNYCAQLEDQEDVLSCNGPDKEGERLAKHKCRARDQTFTLQRIVRIRDMQLLTTLFHIMLILYLKKWVIIMSILMMSINQKCNLVASIISIFCHSTLAPELVIKMLAHTGLSNSLLKKSNEKLHNLAKTFLMGFCL